MSKTIAERLAEAGITATPEQLAAAERAFAATDHRAAYIALRAENPIAAAWYAQEHPAAYGDRK